MSYRVDIFDNNMCIYGLYGTYSLSENPLSVSVTFDTCVNEIDEDGEEYLVETGQAWSVPLKDFTELENFIKTCEKERLWNYIHGPVFKIKPDVENGILYARGLSTTFAIGQEDNKLYIDSGTDKKHDYTDGLSGVIKKLTVCDKWWQRDAEETLDMVRNGRCTAIVTSGGNLRLEYKNKKMLVGQKSDGTFWVNIVEDNDKHVYYKNNWADVVKLLV